MKYLFFLFICFGLSSCQSAGDRSSILSPEAFEAMLKSDPRVQLLDVRSPEEFQEGHLAQAQNLNVESADFKEKASQLDKNRPVMVYCLKGGRSADAAAQISKMGFPQIYDLGGGITAWKKAGKTVVK